MGAAYTCTTKQRLVSSLEPLRKAKHRLVVQARAVTDYTDLEIALIKFLGYGGGFDQKSFILIFF